MTEGSLPSPRMSKIERVNLVAVEPVGIVEFLATASGLSKARIKDAMTKGAVWLKRDGRQRRLRRAKTIISPDDAVSLYFDSQILDDTPPAPELIADLDSCSVWYKPAGLVCGGTRYGDHFAVDRLVERQLDRPTLLVHRLDRFVSGVMLLAHGKTAAAQLSAQFQSRQTLKIYRATVHGLLKSSVTVEEPVDGKAALSRVVPVAEIDENTDVEVTIETGRKHQIRKHLAHIGHPIIGDRQYGSDGFEDLQLRSIRLGFCHPDTDEWLTFEAPDQPAK